MNKIGLALSGGGYRAAAFHLGTLRKLNEMEILDKVNVLSTVSGGSIIGAAYVLQLNDNKDFKTFEENFKRKLKQSVIKKVLTSSTFIKIILGVCAWLSTIVYLQFTSYAWLGIVLFILGIFFIIKYQFKIFPVSKIIERIYNNIFFNNKNLSNFYSNPVIAVNSTNLQTGRQFTFSKSRMGDSTYTSSQALFKPENFPIARAVMASSSVPFAFTPVSVDASFYITSVDGEYIKPVLVDGGVYDNQGIHKLTHPSNPPYENFYECNTVITSDAGNKMPFEGAFNNLIILLFRCIDLFMNRIKMFQIMQNIYLNTTIAKREIAYISLGWNLDRCITGFVDNLRSGNIIKEVIEAHDININDPDQEIIKTLKANVNYDSILSRQLTKSQLNVARSVATNLTALSDEQINCLAKHAELQTELQVKLYCPSLLNYSEKKVE